MITPFLPEVRLSKDMDLVKLLSGTADSVAFDDNKELELTLMWPLCECWSTLFIEVSPVVELACLTVETVMLYQKYLHQKFE